MIEIGGPVLAAILLWWASTGAILYLDGLPRRTFKWSMAAIAGAGLVALLAIALWRGDTSSRGAYVAFIAGLALWSVPTAAFYFGAVTGPRRTPMMGDLQGLARFRAAVETVLYNEVLSALGALVLVLLLADAANQLALWTYLVLWAMHVSGKLNMYFGVPNLSEEFLPPHLAYLATYMRKRPMNLLFPISVSLSTAATLAFATLAYQAPAGSHMAVGMTLLAVLSGLAVLEHWLLVLPLSPMALWNWSLRSRVVAPSVQQPAEAPFGRPALEAGSRAE
jgi:putative photosynthetic complex assembly protein 2